MMFEHIGIFHQNPSKRITDSNPVTVGGLRSITQNHWPKLNPSLSQNQSKPSLVKNQSRTQKASVKSLQNFLVPSPASDAHAGGPVAQDLLKQPQHGGGGCGGSSLLLRHARLAVLQDAAPLGMLIEAHRSIAADIHGRKDCPQSLQVLQRELHRGGSAGGDLGGWDPRGWC